jgi:hypothetical protein
MGKTTYILNIVNRKTGDVHVETRKSYDAFDRLWSKAMENVNPLTHKLVDRTIYLEEE